MRSRVCGFAFAFALAACKSPPTDAQVADARARFEHADEADHEPDVAFRRLLTAVRTTKSDGAKECPTPWAYADRDIFFQGLGAWGAEVALTGRPVSSTTLMQIDNVTVAGHDVPLDKLGSASRKRRRELENTLLQRKGEVAELSGKDFMARAASILDAPLSNELFIDLESNADPTVRDKDSFSGGFGAGRAYLFDHAAQRFTCAGTFTAENSTVVESRVAASFSVNTDLYVHVIEAAKQSLHAL